MTTNAKWGAPGFLYRAGSRAPLFHRQGDPIDRTIRSPDTADAALAQRVDRTATSTTCGVAAERDGNQSRRVLDATSKKLSAVIWLIVPAIPIAAITCPE